MSFVKQELKPAQEPSGCSFTHIDHDGCHPIAGFQLEDGAGRRRSVVKMRFVMAADAVIDHLQVLAMWMLHIKTSQHGDPLVQSANGRLCRALQPRTKSKTYCYDYSWANITNAAASFKCRCETNVFQAESRMGQIKSSFLPFADAVLCRHLFVSGCYHRASQLDDKDKKKSCLMWVRIRTAMLWWRAQLQQHVSNTCMTAHSYQISRTEDWELGESATWIQNCCTRWNTNYTPMCKWETRRSDTIFFQLNQSLTVIFFPPIIEDSHSILLVLCSNKY